MLHRQQHQQEVRVVAKAPEWAHVQAMQRPSMFYLWELYWDAEVAYRHVARAFASVRKENKGRMLEQRDYSMQARRPQSIEPTKSVTGATAAAPDIIKEEG